MEHHNLTEPVEPVCGVKKKTVVKESKDVEVESINPVLNNLLYGFIYEKYMVKWKVWINKAET